MSLESNTQVTHTLIFPITMYRWESRTVKKADRKKIYIYLILNMILEENLMDTLDHQKDEQEDLRAN